jgi:hypothetical protein
MKKVKKVVVLSEVAQDLNNGKDFYDQNEPGVGDYFWDSLMADIKSLISYSGIHPIKNGYYRMPAKRFPYYIYYTIAEGNAYVFAVLPMRKDPLWIEDQLRDRS